MTSQMTIRRAQPKDSDGIMKLLRQVNDVHADGRPDIFIHGHTKYTPEELLEIMADTDRPIFVAIDSDENLVGYCFCVIQDQSKSTHLAPIKTLYIDDLCVDSTRRGSGIGRTLYEWVKAYAQREGFYNLTLNVWSCNPGAIKFYEQLGLRPQKIGMETLL